VNHSDRYISLTLYIYRGWLQTESGLRIESPCSKRSLDISP